MSLLTNVGDCSTYSFRVTGSASNRPAGFAADADVLNGVVVSVEVQRVRRLIDGLRRDRRVHPYHGRREYSLRAREVAEACAALIDVEPAAVPTLMRLHSRACCAAAPDPKRLAAWLAKLRLDGRAGRTSSCAASHRRWASGGAPS